MLVDQEKSNGLSVMDYTNLVLFVGKQRISMVTLIPNDFSPTNKPNNNKSTV